ncbi:MAG: flagellar basal body P-ring protein FlgI [Phycisphaeraceae bacterium]
MRRAAHSATAWTLALTVAAVAGAAGGCQGDPDPTPSAPPAPSWSGPAYLRGTVGSMAGLRNYQPLLVEGYGVVIGLEGTGSSELPVELRERLLQHARQMGVGSSRAARDLPEEYREFARMSPERFLRSRDTAIVAVQGLVPPGAAAGARFDVLVSALRQTQTTSLAGGMLWTTDLGVGGANMELQFTRPRAEASGPIYQDPRQADDAQGRAATEHMVQAVVINGGRATESRGMELVLNQESYTRSREVADRINERFPTEPGERGQTANAVSPMIIELQIPRRYQDRPAELIDLIAHLYIGGGVGFEQRHARHLGRVLESDVEQAPSVVLAWHALGRTIQPIVREYYGHDELVVRLAALEAGARLEDEQASEMLLELAGHADADVRQRVAQTLVHLPRSRRGARALAHLVDDEATPVRLAAYETLARIGDRDRLERFVVRNRRGVKFIIDRVDAERPLIYVTQEQVPRLVIFGPDMSLSSPVFASLWDNRLVLRGDEEQGYVEVYYQAPRAIEGQRYKVQPSVAALAFMLAHEPSVELPHDGLNLSYSEVVDVISRLADRGVIDAEMQVRRSPLAELVAQAMAEPGFGRPELADGEEWDADEGGLATDAPGVEPPNLDDPAILQQGDGDGGGVREERGPTRIGAPSIGQRSSGVQRGRQGSGGDAATGLHPSRPAAGSGGADFGVPQPQRSLDTFPVLHQGGGADGDGSIQPRFQRPGDADGRE